DRRAFADTGPFHRQFQRRLLGGRYRVQLHRNAGPTVVPRNRRRRLHRNSCYRAGARHLDPGHRGPGRFELPDAAAPPPARARLKPTSIAKENAGGSAGVFVLGLGKAAYVPGAKALRVLIGSTMAEGFTALPFTTSIAGKRGGQSKARRAA